LAGDLLQTTAWGAYNAPPDPVEEFKGPTPKGNGGEGRGREERRGEGKRGHPASSTPLKNR